MAKTINKQSPATPELGDLMAIWQTTNSDTRNCSLTALFTLFSESFMNTVLEPDSQYAAPAVTAFDIQINSNNNDTHLILTPAGTLAAGTITLPTPANLRDKQLLICSCTQQVTALTIAGNGASAVNGAPTALSADDFFTLKYDLTLNTWNRIS